VVTRGNFVAYNNLALARAANMPDAHHNLALHYALADALAATDRIAELDAPAAP
jgi:hypothetical protein